MATRRERGQERPEKPTVGKREPGSRPRIKKEESAPRDWNERRQADRKSKANSRRIGFFAEIA